LSDQVVKIVIYVCNDSGLYYKFVKNYLESSIASPLALLVS
jgi:hypothetical protein